MREVHLVKQKPCTNDKTEVKTDVRLPPLFCRLKPLAQLRERRRCRRRRSSKARGCGGESMQQSAASFPFVWPFYCFLPTRPHHSPHLRHWKNINSLSLHVGREQRQTFSQSLAQRHRDACHINTHNDHF